MVAVGELTLDGSDDGAVYSPPALLRACPVEKGGPVLPEERPRIHENSVTETPLAHTNVRPCVLIFSAGVEKLIARPV